MEGFILKYRKFLDNPISHNLELAGLRDYLLLRANHKDNDIYIGYDKIKVKKGQFIGSQKKMSIRFGITLNKTHRLLKILEKEGFIETKGTNKYTVITIQNRDRYQVDRNPVETQQKPNRNPVETDNNVITMLEQSNSKKIFITSKQDINDLFDSEYIKYYATALKCLWIFIESGYKIEKKEKEIKKFIDWLKEKANIYGYILPTGLINRGDMLMRFDRWKTRHEDNDKPIKKYKSSVLVFLDNKGKQKK